MTERRFDPITGEWRTFATHRQERTFLPSTADCPLCPTKDPARPTEVPWEAFDIAVFDNRFPSLMADPPEPAVAGGGPFEVEPAGGATEVIVYSDAHDATLTSLGVDRIRLLVDVWADRYAALGSRDDVAYVFVFENRGEAIGVTLHHPHGQVYAFPEVPPLPARELEAARRHLASSGRCVMCDVVAQERFDGARVISQNGVFVAFVPFAARFPYEVHVATVRHAPSILDLSDPERDAFAAILLEIVSKYDGLFSFPLPYVMSVHQAPTDDGDWQEVSHLHVEFTPFHRTAEKLKYLAGSELGGGSYLNDVAPEDAASRLRRSG